jgi:hypothetical protein
VAVVTPATARTTVLPDDLSGRRDRPHGLAVQELSISSAENLNSGQGAAIAWGAQTRSSLQRRRFSRHS